MHFARGYFDGDGSIGRYKGGYRASMTGTKEFLTAVQKALNIDYVLRKKGRAYQFGAGGFGAVERMLSPIYENATVYMKSKYKIYKKLLKENKLKKQEKKKKGEKALELYKKGEALYVERNLSMPEIKRILPQINIDVLPYFLKINGHDGFARPLSEEEKRTKEKKLRNGLLYFVQGYPISMAARKAEVGLKQLKLFLHEEGIREWKF